MSDKGWEKRSSFPRNQRDGIEGGTPRPARVGGGICTLLEETARRRLDALPLEAVAAQIAALEAGELLALARHRRPRLVPSAEPPAAAVAARRVQMSAAELRELGRRLQERRAAEA